MWPFGLGPGVPSLAKASLSKLHTTAAKPLIFKSPTLGRKQWGKVQRAQGKAPVGSPDHRPPARAAELKLPAGH